MVRRGLNDIAVHFVMLYPAQATVMFLPAKDNTLYQDAEGNVSNVSGQHMFVGRINRGSLRRPWSPSI